MQPIRVLVVDDDRGVRLVARACLEMEGFEVTLAGTGREAVERLKTSIPDVILLDARMPEMGGAALLAALKAVPATARIPVVAMTGEALRGERERLRAAGAVDVLLKPLDPVSLPDQLRQFATEPARQAAA